MNIARLRTSCGWLLALGLLFFATNALAEEWPKWLGPNGNGISTQEGLLDQWPQGGPEKVWSAHVGRGFSSPIGFDGKVYLLSMRGSNDNLTAFDAATGKVIWSEANAVTHRADQPQARNDDNGLPLPLATPAIDHDRIYTYGGGGDLICRSLNDGQKVWAINILDEMHTQILGWNQASSPLVDEKYVYVQGGQDGPIAIAVDKQSGKIGWTSQAKGLSGYAAPIMIDVQGARQLIILGGDRLYALNPNTGVTIWTFPWKTDYDVNAATPVYRDGHLFISSGYGHGCAMLAVDATSAKEVWQNTEVTCKFQPPILSGDRLYANSAGRLKCLQWPTPKVLWKSSDVKLREGGTIVLAGSKMIAMSEDGTLSLLRINNDGASVVSEAHLFDGDNVWSMPLIYRGNLYAMGGDELVCLKITSQQK